MNYCSATGKRSYASKWEAQTVRRKISERTRRSRSNKKRRRWEAEPYMCEHCGLWHLSSTSIV